jgi:HAE1 family hydrophobic/amphiphilic exporter-1
MDEDSSPLIAIALVLSAVFIPTAFVSGITGQFYRQFAVTIATATVISAFVSLTLSPALSAMLFKPHDAGHQQHRMTFGEIVTWPVHQFFRGFNYVFGALDVAAPPGAPHHRRYRLILVLSRVDRTRHMARGAY